MKPHRTPGGDDYPVAKNKKWGYHCMHWTDSATGVPSLKGFKSRAELGKAIDRAERRTIDAIWS